MPLYILSCPVIFAVSLDKLSLLLMPFMTALKERLPAQLSAFVMSFEEYAGLAYPYA
jgi:hypothetical protein